MSDMVGSSIGSYRITSLLGVGGVAATYLAEDPRYARPVVIKVLPRLLSLNKKFRAALENEQKIIRQLNHPNIVQIYELGEDDNGLFIAMEFMPLGDLKTLLSEGPLKFSGVAKVIREVGEALDQVHHAGFLHNDIKPSNILFDERGAAHLSDFGMATAIRELTLEEATGAGAAEIATPSYMAPELMSGGNVTAASDIYSLGVVLFRMLTGELPYSGDTPVALLMKALRDPIPDISKWHPEMAVQLQGVLNRALAKSPDERFKDAVSMADAFDAAIQDAVKRPLTSTEASQRDIQYQDHAEILREYRQKRQSKKARRKDTLSIQTIGILFGVLAVILAIGGTLFKSGGLSFREIVNEFYGNIATDLASIALTILLIDRLTANRLEEQEKSQLVRQLRLGSNGFARQALEEIRERGWLSDGSLRTVRLDKAILNDADLSGADLAGASLLATELSASKIHDADLEACFLNDVNLRNASIVGSNLTDSQMRAADLSYSRIWDSDLSFAWLIEANLKGADLTGTSLRGAILERANLEDAKGLTDRQLASSRRLYQATMPDGSLYDGHFNLKDDLELAEKYSKVDISDPAQMASWYGVTLDQYLSGQAEG